MIETSIDERRHPGQQHEQTDNNSRLAPSCGLLTSTQHRSASCQHIALTSAFSIRATVSQGVLYAGDK